MLLAASFGLWFGSYFDDQKVPPGSRPASQTNTQPEWSARTTIAVLPFKRGPDDRQGARFALGFTDTLTTSLMAHRFLRVTGSSSLPQVPEADLTVGAIGTQLDVAHVVQGVVSASKDKVRVSAQLLSVNDGAELWQATRERPLSEVLELQRELSHEIAKSLPGFVAADEHAPPVPAVDATAQVAYLKGAYFRSQLTLEGYRRGLAYFQRAIDRAPNFAQAYAGLASCYCLLGGHGLEAVEPTPGMTAAKVAASKANVLDPNAAEPYAYLGIIQLKYDWDWDGAEVSMRKAIALNPSLFRARIFYSFYLEAMGRHEEAIEQARKANSLSPLSMEGIVNLGWQHFQAGELDAAKKFYDEAVEFDAGFWGGHWALGHYFRRKGQLDHAIDAFRRAVELEGGHSLPLSALGHAYAVAGRQREALDTLEALRASALDAYVSPYHLSIVHLGLGELDQAFEQLNKAVTMRSRSLAWLNVAGEFDSIRSDPRFVAILEQVGLPDGSRK